METNQTVVSKKFDLKIETYQQQKQRHSKELDEFQWIFFAFNNDQLKEGLSKFNCSTSDIVSIGAGGFVLKAKYIELVNLLKRHKLEVRELKNNYAEFYKALVYELCNHEYCITHNPQPALDVLGVKVEDVDQSVLRKACNEALQVL